ncbi:hypothetical protein BJ166DRAFT_500388 [Pestalotiopsis sp. NC0098]|nr:hypothetical protein BJ166DRAFT_500388 [Pestalotiopsis sp. NC0098]
MSALGHQKASEPVAREHSGGSGKTLSAMATDCERNFKERIQMLRTNGYSEFETTMRKYEQKFLDWEVYIGVFAGTNGGLDQRLEHHPQYRDLILMMLNMLSSNLIQSIPKEPTIFRNTGLLGDSNWQFRWISFRWIFR